MKYKERRAKLDKLEKAIEKELKYDKDEDYPDKYELNEKLILGDEYAKKTVIDTYKNINTLYGFFNPAATSLGMDIFLYVVMTLINLAAIAFTIVLFVRQSKNSAFACVITLGFFLLTYLILKMTRSQKMYVNMFKEEGKNILIYKHEKKDIYIVYLGKNQIYRYEDEEWHKITARECFDGRSMGGRLLFQHLCGELIVKKHKKGVIEIYCRNRACFEYKIKPIYGNSANFFIKDGKPWRVDYYPPYYSAGRVRAQQSVRLDFLEINTDRVAEIPKSFLKFCEKEGIEPLQENEHLRYI